MSELTLLLRFIIDDVDQPQKYGDSRLQQLIIAGGQLAQRENVFLQDYTLNISAISIIPDPTDTTTTVGRDDAFINLSILKAACLLASSSLGKSSKENISVKEGPYQFDGRGKFDGAKFVAQSACQSYKDAQWEYSLHNRYPGSAIIGPFQVMLNEYRTGRDGYACGRYTGIH